MDRYRVELASGLSRAFFRVRARVVDAKSGEWLETNDVQLAEELCALLRQDGSDHRDELPSADASPFAAYHADIHPGDSWNYLQRASRGHVGYAFIGRTKSAPLARQAAAVLNRAHPTRLKGSDGPVKAGWF